MSFDDRNCPKFDRTCVVNLPEGRFQIGLDIGRQFLGQGVDGIDSRVDLEGMRLEKPLGLQPERLICRGHGGEKVEIAQFIILARLTVPVGQRGVLKAGLFYPAIETLLLSRGTGGRRLGRLGGREDPVGLTIRQFLQRNPGVHKCELFDLHAPGEEGHEPNGAAEFTGFHHVGPVESVRIGNRDAADTGSDRREDRDFHVPGERDLPLQGLSGRPLNLGAVNLLRHQERNRDKSDEKQSNDAAHDQACAFDIHGVESRLLANSLPHGSGMCRVNGKGGTKGWKPGPDGAQHRLVNCVKKCA